VFQLRDALFSKGKGEANKTFNTLAVSHWSHPMYSSTT
jgi:hypothetical protein